MVAKIVRIQRQQYFDKFGKMEREHWTIEEQCKGLFGWKWRPLKHRIYRHAGARKRITRFASMDEAQKVVDKLSKELPVDKWVSTVVREQILC